MLIIHKKPNKFYLKIIKLSITESYNHLKSHML